MIEGLPPTASRPLTLIQGGAAEPAKKASPTTGTQPDGDIPATPPADVLAELDRAAQVLHELSRRNVNLHFEVDQQSKQIHVQVLDGEGRVVREIPPKRLLDVFSGGTGQGLAVSTIG